MHTLFYCALSFFFPNVFPLHHHQQSICCLSRLFVLGLAFCRTTVGRTQVLTRQDTRRDERDLEIDRAALRDTGSGKRQATSGKLIYYSGGRLGWARRQCIFGVLNFNLPCGCRVPSTESPLPLPTIRSCVLPPSPSPRTSTTTNHASQETCDWSWYRQAFWSASHLLDVVVHR